MSQDRRDLTRRQFERAAELDRSADTDPYARRWSLIHQTIAEAAASVDPEEKPDA